MQDKVLAKLELISIEATTLEDGWYKSLMAVLDKGTDYLISRGSFTGRYRKQLDFITVVFRYPGARPLIPFVPEGVPAPTDDDYIAEYLRCLVTSNKQSQEGYIYGDDLEEQIEKVIKMYKEPGPGTNQAYMAVGDRHSLDLEHSQCLRGIDTFVKNNKLHFMVYFRSWDLWAGFPSNLAGIQLLKEYMAQEIGVQDGEMIVTSKGLHLYDYSFDVAKRVLNRK